MVVDVAFILTNITGFCAGSKIEQRHNDVWHWFKHCFGVLGDTQNVMSVREYLSIGREIGYRAAHNQHGTYVKVRQNDEIVVYWEPRLGQRGMFMVVRPLGTSVGEIVTLFSPDEGKRYFDFQEPVMATFH
jgi:hypothetical protein